jgi:hypothetical protein
LYPAVPPLALIDAAPVEAPKHKIFVGVFPAVRTVGWVIVAEVVAVQPFASVKVTL